MCPRNDKCAYDYKESIKSKEQTTIKHAVAKIRKTKDNAIFETKYMKQSL